MAEQNDEKLNVQDGVWDKGHNNARLNDVFADMQPTEPEIVDEDMQITPEVFDSVRNDLHLAVDSFTYDGERVAAGDAVYHHSGEPQKRSFVAGTEDVRDASLEEKPLSEDTVWVGRIFDVNRLRVSLPDGRTALRDVVRHPGAVAIVALTDEGRICLVRQYRTALGRVTVEIPAGKLDPGEDPLDCAHRELLEETGMKAGKMAFLTTTATSDGFTDELIHLYMATELSFEGSDPDADEFINVDLVPLSELVDAVLDGKVEDAKTIIGALLCDSISHRLPME